MKVLFLSYPTADYGSDFLYHGFCELYGRENVVDCPVKTTLHFDTLDSSGESCHDCTQQRHGLKIILPENQGGRPCYVEGGDCSSHPSHLMVPLSHRYETWGEIITDVRAHKFDIIIFTSTIENFLKENFFEKIKSVDIPIIPVDYSDVYSNDIGNFENVACRKLSIYFKREHRKNIEYTSNTYPILYSYPEERSGYSFDRSIDLFACLGSVHLSPRQRAYEILKNIKHSNKLVDLSKKMHQIKYREILKDSYISVHVRGGWDCWNTLRLAESMAFGNLIIAEEPSIFTDGEFKDMENIIFCKDDYSDLEEKIMWALENRMQGTNIAMNSYQNYLKNHTTKSKARYIIDICKYEGIL